MIAKHFVLKKSLENNKYFLIYGKNRGLIEEILENKLRPNLPKNYYKYEEAEILRNLDNFQQDILNQSLFENEKLIIIKRVSDKVFSVIKNIISRNISNLYLILLSENLDKKSKIRKYFEKEKETICIPVYEDNLQTLSNIVFDFMREKKINVSQQIVNIIVERAAGDRLNLRNELEKIENFTLKNKKISIDDILKISNLSENYNISDLVDSCLSKNKKKTIKIFNENNFNSDDCIIILRTFLIKLKRLENLHHELISKNQNVDMVVSSFKPPIFWKEKEVVKQQIMSINYSETRNLMTKTNEIELLVKKNPQSSLNITTDFLLGCIR